MSALVGSREKEALRGFIRIPNTLVYSVFPASIVVQGNTAVALYYRSIVNEDHKGDRETTHFKEVDVLIRENGEWKFLSWMGADEPNQGG